MNPENTPIEDAVRALQQRFGDAPTLGVVLGSGLGAVSDRLAQAVTASYGEVGLPDSGVQGHHGVLHRGDLNGVPTAVLAGRVHMYEGHPPARVVRAVRALHRWGVKTLILTCSVGGLRPELGPGTLVSVSDHINLQGVNPLIGPAWGTRFPDMTQAYCPQLRSTLAATARDVGVRLESGVLVAMSGPAYETPAEVRMLGALGGDVVSMSTAPEVLAAREVGLPVAAIAVVANPGAGLHDRLLTHEDVTESAHRAAASLGLLLETAAPALVA
jgi:inosine/guanosine/xanthosine phosphorylase family protein